MRCTASRCSSGRRSRPSYLVRDWLNTMACDVVMGLDTGDDRVVTSTPYYRAPYVFILRDDSELAITSFDSPDLMKANKIGFVPGTPVQTMLEKHNLFGANFNYMRSLTNFKSPRNQYVRIDPKRMVEEVANGKADLAIAFAPEVARYVKNHPNLRMVVVPDNNTRVDGEKVPFHFNQSVAVRKEDEGLLAEMNFALDKAKAQIDSVLQAEGFPLLTPVASGDDKKGTEGAG
jgi:mxaJ protein